MSGVILAFGKVTDEQCWAAVNGQRLDIRRLRQNPFLLTTVALVEQYGTTAQRNKFNQSEPGKDFDIAKAAVRPAIAALGNVKAVVMDEATWQQWDTDDPADTVLHTLNRHVKLWVVRKNGGLELVS